MHEKEAATRNHMGNILLTTSRKAWMWVSITFPKDYRKLSEEISDSSVYIY